MAYILDGMAIAQEGQLAPTPSGAFCLQPFALATQGIVVFPEVDAEVFPNASADPMDRRRIEAEDDEILALVMAFMSMRNKWH